MGHDFWYIKYIIGNLFLNFCAGIRPLAPAAKTLYRGPENNDENTMDRTDQSGDWASRLSPDLATLESIALTAYSHLPPEFRSLTGDVQIVIADFPTEEISDDLGLETPFDLLGLFEGRGIAERWNPGTGEEANRITLYRRAILDYWSENEESLGDIITHVLIHELGHHFGLSDSDMERIEEAAE